MSNEEKPAIPRHVRTSQAEAIERRCRSSDTTAAHGRTLERCPTCGTCAALDGHECARTVQPRRTP